MPRSRELARHGAHTFWSLLTRMATLVAHTLLRIGLPEVAEIPNQPA